MLCELLVFFHRTLWNLGTASPGPRELQGWTCHLSQANGAIPGFCWRRRDPVFCSESQKDGTHASKCRSYLCGKLARVKPTQREAEVEDEARPSSAGTVGTPESSCACRPFPVPSSSMSHELTPSLMLNPLGATASAILLFSASFFFSSWMDHSHGCTSMLSFFP